MSPLTNTLSFLSTMNTPRCEQPGQSVGGRSGRSSATGRGTGPAGRWSTPGTPARGQGPSDHAGVELAAEGQQFLAAVDLDAHQLDELLQEGVELLDHVELLHARAEVGDQSGRQRVGQPQLEEAGLGKRLPRVL